MKKILLVLIVTFATLGYAEPVSLWCTDGDAEEAAKTVKEAPAQIKLLNASIQQLTAEVKKWEAAGQAKLVSLTKKRLWQDTGAESGYRNAQTMCVDSEWWEAQEFIFDTDGLKNPSLSNAEMTFVYYCGGWNVRTIKAELSSTPSVISFDWEYEIIEGYTARKRFDLDRKTLKGGYETNRNFTCALRDVDTSDNLI
jgi:hypothetical protein